MIWLQKIIEDLLSNRILLNSEMVTIRGPKGEGRFPAKIDTGAEQSSIDTGIAQQLGLLHPNQHIGKRWVKSGLGKQERSIVACEIQLKGKWQKTSVTYTDRSHLRFPVLIGRADMQGYLIKPVFPKET